MPGIVWVLVQQMRCRKEASNSRGLPLEGVGGRLWEEECTRISGFTLHRLQKLSRIELVVSSHQVEALSHHSLYLWGPAHSRSSENSAKFN